MKKFNKGFTLAELLIVVAIIAVLVAVAIPTFNDQLEKSRQSTDLSNLRDAYAAAKLAEINGETPAVDATGKSIKPIKIGAPIQINNMSDDEKKNYSGIGYAFVYDTETSLLYPYTMTTPAAPTATTTPAATDCYYTLAGGVTNPACVLAGTTNYNNILGEDVPTKLKAHSQEIRVDPSNLPGGNKGIIEYGIPVAATAGTTAAYTDGASLRLWGNTAMDYNRARIVVEFTYDKTTGTWGLQRVYKKTTGAAAANPTTKATTGEIELGAIRFATIGTQPNGPTGAKSVCPAFVPNQWAATNMS